MKFIILQRLFVIHSFHVGTLPAHFYGNQIFDNNKIIINYGNLINCLVGGYLLIVDEIFASLPKVMSSLAPCFERDNFEYIYSRNEAPIKISKDFLYIAWYNELEAKCRNKMPERWTKYSRYWRNFHGKK